MTASAEYRPVFAGKALDDLQQLLPRYPNKQAALLPVLLFVPFAKPRAHLAAVAL